MAASDPVRQDPTVMRVRAALAALDPDALAAVDDVDRSLIVSALQKDPWLRVREGLANATFLEGLRRCLPTSSKG